MFKHVDVCIPSKIEFVKQKWEINRSTLYNFNGASFLPADVCEFLEKFAVDFKYCFLLIFLILKFILIQWNQEGVLQKNWQIL